MPEQNTSSAVMAHRKPGTAEAPDDFPTPPWATRAFVEALRRPINGYRIWEPACGRGHMAKVLEEYCPDGHVWATDKHDYGGTSIWDFLEAPRWESDWIITNPPFRLASDFIERAFKMRPTIGFALLVRTVFQEGATRHDDIFTRYPPSEFIQYAERVSMVQGRLDATVSSATAYQWAVWYMNDFSGETKTRWIPPCRKRLTKPGDYPEPVSHPR